MPTSSTEARHRMHRQNPHPRPKGWRAWFKLTAYGLVFFLVITVGLVAWASQDLPDPNRLTDRQFAQSTKIYDRTGQHLLYEIFADQKRTLVELSEIPQYLKDGVIATEDTQFYEHNGIRPLSMLRAIFYGLIPGRRIAGTSTLTQQLVKNAILTNERTVTRKIKEIILSLRLEQKYTKDQILKIYFNEIPYGSTNYGIESAAQSYFGKHVSDLSLAEAATLAGFPQKPSVYLNNPDALKTRRNFVLQRMVDEGYITKETADKTMTEPLVIKRQIHNIVAPHFVLYVKEQLVEKYGENTVDKGGLKVITTLDWDKQEIADKTIGDKGKSLLEQGGANNAALVALDPRTGQILALVGSRDYYDDSINGQFNVVTLGRRQPGSSIKPIIYTAAFEKGYTPNTILNDVVTAFSTGPNPYVPKNYNLGERGPVTMRQALQGSLNIPAVQTLYLVGLQNGIKFAERLGYSTFSNGNFGLTLVLGGGEVKMLEHVNAFATFANNGMRNEPVSILKVTDSKDDTLYEWKPNQGESVLDPKIAATITDVLSDNAARAYVFGANNTQTLPGRPVAAKTGTTNNYVDAWQVGYTPSLVAGVWAGNTDNTPMKKGYGGSKVAGEIWNYFMKEAVKNSPVESFPPLPAITTTKPILNGSPGGSLHLLVDKVTGKLATSSTPEHYIVERSFVTPHSILYYIDKNDPQGPAPEHPENDPQFNLWENAIQNWITRQKTKNPDLDISFETPPTEYDDVHSLDLIPKLEVNYPHDNEVFTNRQITTDIKINSTRGINKVTYKIDDAFVSVVTDLPFNLNYTALTLEPGSHTISIIAEDDVGNRVVRDVPFTLQTSAIPAGFFFSRSFKILSSPDFPVSLFLTPYKIEELKELHVTAGSPNGSIQTLFQSTNFSDLFGNRILVPWNTAPAPGVWKLTAEVITKNGENRVSDIVNIEVK